MDNNYEDQEEMSELLKYHIPFNIEKYEGMTPPFVVYHENGTAQVVYVRDEQGRPIRIPAFLVEADLVEKLSDSEIVNFGLQHLAELTAQLYDGKRNDN